MLVHLHDLGPILGRLAEPALAVPRIHVAFGSSFSRAIVSSGQGLGVP